MFGFSQSFYLIQDSADGIANELLTAGLIVGDDLVAMAANLDKLISTPPTSKQLCFRISSGIAQQETPDERALLGQSLTDNRLLNVLSLSIAGFAQLSIVD